MDLVWVPVAMFLSGAGVSFGTGAVLKRDSVFAKGLILSSAAAFIAFVYWLAYWSLDDIFTKLALFDAVTPAYGLVALLLIPFSKTGLELAWRGINLVDVKQGSGHPTSTGINSETLGNEPKTVNIERQQQWEQPKAIGKIDVTKAVLKKLKELERGGLLKPEIYELCKIYLTTQGLLPEGGCNGGNNANLE